MARKPSVTTRLDAVERRLNLIEAALDIDPGSYLRCRANPVACGDKCTRDGCPLQANRVQRLASIIVEFTEEVRWQRAWADEMAAQGVYPVGTEDRVQLRVKKSQLEELLRQAQGDVGVVPGLERPMGERILEIRKEIEDINTTLAKGC